MYASSTILEAIPATEAVTAAAAAALTATTGPTAPPDGDILEAMSRVLPLEVGPKLLVSNNGEQACLECYWHGERR